MNKFLTKFPERKAGVSGSKPTVKAGTPAGTPPPLTESTAAWKPAGPGWGTSFNRKTKVPVVKTRAKKQGLD